MGATYSQLVVLGRASDRVIAALGARAGFVAEAVDDAVGVFLDELAYPEPADVADDLVQHLDATVLWFVVDDSDVLRGGVRAPGRPAVDFVVPERRLGIGWRGRRGSTDAFVGEVVALGLADESTVSGVFRRSFTFEDDRHEELLSALGLPTWLRGVGYRYILMDGPTIVPVRMAVSGSG